jgi:RNA polymerase sigma-70 factor (ECF subfamily)
MLNVATQARDRTEDAVRSLLLSRVADAHRLANWILHDSVAAEDAVQEAALLAWDRRRTLRSEATVAAWFDRILVNVCRQELRRRARRPAVAEIDPDRALAGEGPPDRLAERDELTRAIRTLEPDEQLLLALRFGRDLTVPQIAAETGIREGTVKSRLHSALEHLRAALESERRAEEALR